METLPEKTQLTDNPKVIEYLSKKGYSRTEAMLRTESAAHDAEGRPIVTRAEDEGGKQWFKAMGQYPAAVTLAQSFSS